MAKKTRSSQAQTGPTVSPAHGLQLLRTHYAKGKQLLANCPLTSPAEQTWETVTRDVLSRAFGPDSPNVSSVMDAGKFKWSFGGGDESQWEQGRVEDMETRLQIIKGLMELLESDAKSAQTDNVPFTPSPLENPSSKRIFLVHGHNEAMIHETARFLEKLDLSVIVLREQPNSGRTIIEKFID